jgi:exodeoxyribonuclease-3
MRIATFNVNSVKQRVEPLKAWLKSRAPDIVCLQEIKCVDDAFPRAEFEALGYNVDGKGPRTYNGVAVLSKMSFDVVTPRLPGDDADDHARYLEVIVSIKNGVLRVASIYLPNGNPANEARKYGFKLAWMDRLIARARDLLTTEEPTVLAGDYNVIPTPNDVYAPERWLTDALFLPTTRAKFREFETLGYVDAVRASSDEKGLYTFWDYQAGAFQKNNGLRIDHLMLSPQAADRLAQAGVDKDMRAKEKPSDHVPVWIDLNVEPR